MRFEGKTIFVTGGAGFIGSAVIRHLLADTQANVVNIDKLTYAACLDSIPSQLRTNRYRFQNIDICDATTLGRAFHRYQPQYVLNLAAESHVDRSIDGPADFIRTNVLGTFTLLQEALRHWQRLSPSDQKRFKLHHVSTDEVYGTLGSYGYFTEETRYAPNSPYSASKASSDHLVRAWRETYGLPTLVTNCSNNYGPYQFPEKLIPHIIIRALSGEPLPVYGDGQNVRDWLYVEDHAIALTNVLEHGSIGETYNIGASDERANIDVVNNICELLNRLAPSNTGSYERLIAHVPDRPGHDRRYAIDASKIRRELGWAPRTTFDDGLELTVRWYLENRNWWENILARGYGATRLGTAERTYPS
jgi:dTDP-glucose 4,6-dehydratase